MTAARLGSSSRISIVPCACRCASLTAAAGLPVIESRAARLSWRSFVILDRDLMKVPEQSILDTQVLATYLGGKAVYERRSP